MRACPEKEWIDNATPEELLRRWRFAVEDPIFQGATGMYYAVAMSKMQKSLGSEFPALSKKVGWGKKE